MRRVAPLALLLVALLALAACGGGETASPTPQTVEGSVEAPEEEALPEGDAQAGESVFASAGCGGCHTLEAAGTSGTAGPNLNEAKPSYEESYKQIQNGGGGMPAYKDQLSEDEIANVAAYVAESAGG